MSRFNWRLFKPTNLLVLVVILFLVIILVVLPLVTLFTYPLVSLYHEGQCTITAKELRSFGGGGDGDPTYLAHFEYTVRTTDGAMAHDNRYDWFDGAVWLGGPFEEGSMDRVGEQAVLDRYSVGATYRCWYDPRAPSQAVLTRDEDWARLLSANLLFAVVALVGGFVVLAIVVIFVAGLAGLMRRGWRNLQGQPQTAPTARSPDEQRQRAAQSLERLQSRWSNRDPSE